MSGTAPSEFTRRLLDELSGDSYRVRAWRRFFSSSWQRSLEDIRDSPGLTRSFLWSLALIAVPGLLVLLVSWRFQSPDVATTAAAYWLPWYSLAGFFVLTHLGMADDSGGQRHDRFCVPNQLSFARLALAPLVLFPALAVAVQFPGGIVFALFAIILATTDVLDGWYARRMRQVNRLGQMLDYLADLAFLTFLGAGLYLAAAIPASLFWLLMLRYPMTIAAAVVLYFVRGPAELGPTTIGRVITFVTVIVLLWASSELWLDATWLPPSWLDWSMRGLQVLLAINIIYLAYRAVKWNDSKANSGSASKVS